jgi:hypothetical protein
MAIGLNKRLTAVVHQADRRVLSQSVGYPFGSQIGRDDISAVVLERLVADLQFEARCSGFLLVHAKEHNFPAAQDLGGNGVLGKALA